MVMDATPSPQSVGREFVRQYYTLLNKAPDHLHRFYNNHSSFVHGGLEPHNREAPLVIGQKQIYNKIQQLNFRDCHAKISQVDAQSTLGNGVVVQVTGELSNDGQPMRRFTQTFVLAAQSPKKYYVHNDIFRYQDFYSDDEADAESRSENDEEQESEIVDTNQTSQLTQQPQQIYYPLGVAPAGQNVGIQAFPQPPQINGVVHDDLLQVMPTPNLTTATGTPQQQPQPAQPQQQQQPAQQQQQQPQQQPQPTQTQPISIPSEPMSLSAPAPNSNNLMIESTETTVQPNLIENEINKTEPLSSIPMESDQKKDEPIPVEEKPIREETFVQKSTVPEPKTYANLFKSEVSSGISFASAMSNTPSTLNSGNTRSNLNSSSFVTRNQDIRSDTTPTSALPQRSSLGSRPPVRERRSSNATQFGDNHQLFLGNLPHHATEDELKLIFSKFGTVVDLRIHSKSGPKTPGIRAPPNYGFITYDDPESVQNCLANMPFYFPENSPDGQKLNVEEKKTRMRPNESGNGSTNRNMSGLSGNNSSGGGSGGFGGSGGPRLGSGPSSGGGSSLSRGPSSAGMMRSGPPGGPPRSGPPPGGRPQFNRSDNRGTPNMAPRGGNNGTSSVPTGGNTSYGRR